jgi:hypothetical protein
MEHTTTNRHIRQVNVECNETSTRIEHISTICQTSQIRRE